MISVRVRFLNDQGEETGEDESSHPCIQVRYSFQRARLGAAAQRATVAGLREGFARIGREQHNKIRADRIPSELQLSGNSPGCALTLRFFDQLATIVPTSASVVAMDGPFDLELGRSFFGQAERGEDDAGVWIRFQPPPASPHDFDSTT